MSEVLHAPEPECARAVEMLPQFVDGDSGWGAIRMARRPSGSVREMPRGAGRVYGNRLRIIGWGQRLGVRNPPPADAREQLAARLSASAPGARPLDACRGRRRNRRRADTSVGRAAQEASGGEARSELAAFVGIPFLPPLDPHENSTIVRMNIRVAALIAAGYRIAADPDTIVPADVLVGEDGRAHAVRVLSGIEWNGTGD